MENNLITVLCYTWAIDNALWILYKFYLQEKNPNCLIAEFVYQIFEVELLKKKKRQDNKMILLNRKNRDNEAVASSEAK